MEDHLATIWEAIADEFPDSVVLRHGNRHLTWQQFDQRSARLAATMTDAGVVAGDTVAIDLYNCTEYFEVFFAALKIRAVPANVNYRYAHDELLDLLRMSEARALVYHGALADRVIPATAELSGLRLVLRCDDGSDEAPPAGHHDYEQAIARHRPAERIDRAETDVFLSYTGGTTGLPKGVEYLIGPSVRNTQILGRMSLGLYDIDWDGPVMDRVRTLAEHNRRPVAIPASPLMHSTGLIMASLPVLSAGGMVVTLTSRSFDADELLAAVEATRANTISIVGDAMARPILAALTAAAERGHPYDASSLVTITSAGVAFSGDIKSGIVGHIPQVTIVDACGSTEGVTIGMMTTRRGDNAHTDRFLPGPRLRLIGDDGDEIPPGDDRVGRFLGPTVARGYRNDPERTAQVFHEIDGENWVFPGDYGRWNDDGTITLIGRGSSVINTGGEKVFAEEVQNVILDAAGVADCAVVGVPHDRFGSAVAALVETDGSVPLDAHDIASLVRSRLAGYKVPRVVQFGSVPRAPNGKLIYPEVNALLRASAEIDAGGPP